VYPGGGATMIAGQKILYLPGATVLEGGYLHGYITEDNTYCDNTVPNISSFMTGKPEAEQRTEKTSLFTVFPNPTHDKFTLVYNGEPEKAPIRLEILDMHGVTVINEHMFNQRSLEFSIGDKPSGIYLVKVYLKNDMEMRKIVLYK
jgi:hypothetical protein